MLRNFIIHDHLFPISNPLGLRCLDHMTALPRYGSYDHINRGAQEAPTPHCLYPAFHHHRPDGGPHLGAAGGQVQLCHRQDPAADRGGGRGRLQRRRAAAAGARQLHRATRPPAGGVRGAQGPHSGLSQGGRCGALRAHHRRLSGGDHAERGARCRGGSHSARLCRARATADPGADRSLCPRWIHLRHGGGDGGLLGTDRAGDDGGGLRSHGGGGDHPARLRGRGACLHRQPVCHRHRLRFCRHSHR
ncbi:hypothetical protein D3C80_916960 [compost metagenome]